MSAAWAEIVIRTLRNLVAIICAAILVPGDVSVLASPSVTTSRPRRRKRPASRQNSWIPWWLQSRSTPTPC